MEMCLELQQLAVRPPVNSVEDFEYRFLFLSRKEQRVIAVFDRGIRLAKRRI